MWLCVVFMCERLMPNSAACTDCSLALVFSLLLLQRKKKHQVLRSQQLLLGIILWRANHYYARLQRTSTFLLICPVIKRVIKSRTRLCWSAAVRQ